LIPFPENKFLVGICKSKPVLLWPGDDGPSRVVVVRRELLKRLALESCPSIRVAVSMANYDANAPQATIDAICNMLQNMGAQVGGVPGWDHT